MINKLKTAICFGGNSAEHNVSIVSALNIINEIDLNKYEVSLFYINEKGKFENYESTLSLLEKLIKENGNKIFFEPKESIDKILEKISNLIYKKDIENNYIKIINTEYDIVFPIFHGLNGEDGTIQGMFEFNCMPYTGCSHTASAICIDKDITKKICKAENIITADWITLHNYEWKNEKKDIMEKIKNKFGNKVCIKAARLGSSIGVYIVDNEKDLEEKIEEAFKYDNKILLEEVLLKPREITAGVMGFESNIIISELGEFNYVAENYFNYNAKYGSNSRDGIIPPNLEDNIKNNIIDEVKKIFKIFELEGFARIDFFLCNEKLYLNEINTIPGLEKNGTFMRMWNKKNIDYNEFIDNVIFFAKKRVDRSCKRIK